MLPASPWDFDLLMNCSIDLYLCLHHWRTPTTHPIFFYPLLFIPQCKERRMWAMGVGGWGVAECYCMFDLNVQACHLFPPSLLWLPFFSPANLYCGNLRQLSSAQWCKITNLMSHSPPRIPPTLLHPRFRPQPWPRTSLLWIYFLVPP